MSEVSPGEAAERAEKILAGLDKAHYALDDWDTYLEYAAWCQLRATEALAWATLATRKFTPPRSWGVG